MDYVVIGAGPAGVIAAETLRKLDRQGRITLIGDEPEPPYSRMAIPYYLVGSIDEAGTHLRKSPDHFQSLEIDLVQDRVDKIDNEQRQLTLRDGAAVGYDRLLVATGSHPLLPPVEGIDSERVHSCWTLDDARHIASQATPGSRVLLIGAGFIGSIVLEALASRGVALTVVEMGDRMVPRMMNEAAGGMLKSWCEHKGVSVLTGTRVDSISSPHSEGSGLKGFFGRLSGNTDSGSTEAGLRVALSNGETLDVDLVICAAGVAPNLDLLKGSGIKTDQGILVNEYLQSSDAAIYAAGDCAQARDFSTGEAAVHAIQPTAAEHGRIAAQNMTGAVTPYGGSFNMNVLDTLGLVSTSFGLWMGVDGGEHAELSDPGAFRYLNLQFRDDVMVGATSLGMTQHVGVLRGLIQGQVALGKWKQRLLQDPSRVMEAYLDRGLVYR